MFPKFLGNLLCGERLSKKLLILYRNFLNSKLRHGYFSAYITKFSEQGQYPGIDVSLVAYSAFKIDTATF